MGTGETAKERIVRVAIPLFAERGYAGTSVADIQQAAGLAPGSGALYKHFRSKQEVLAAAIDWHIADFERSSVLLESSLPADPLAALRIIVEQLIGSLAANAQLIRITLRDLDARPELADKIATSMLGALHNAIRAWLDKAVAGGGLRPHDTEAVAALLFSAISYYPVVDILLGQAPADIEPDRITAALVDLMGRGLAAA
ncbi:TetR/AcrR family transcriptional regulator [Kibdelosporangium persicum]|nr:TetR family transcriptional regulator [Kibdelosporangium persicum]